MKWTASLIQMLLLPLPLPHPEWQEWREWREWVALLKNEIRNKGGKENKRSYCVGEQQTKGGRTRTHPPGTVAPESFRPPSQRPKTVPLTIEMRSKKFILFCFILFVCGAPSGQGQVGDARVFHLISACHTFCDLWPLPPLASRSLPLRMTPCAESETETGPVAVAGPARSCPFRAKGCLGQRARESVCLFTKGLSWFSTHTHTLTHPMEQDIPRGVVGVGEMASFAKKPVMIWRWLTFSMQIYIYFYSFWYFWHWTKNSGVKVINWVKLSKGILDYALRENNYGLKTSRGKGHFKRHFHSWFLTYYLYNK